MGLSLLYIVCIILANIFAALWQVPLPLGLMVPAGVFFFAPIFTLRDRIQVDRGVKWIYGLIAVSAIVSWLAGTLMGSSLLARISIASVLALLVSEGLDTLIFTVFKRSFVQRALLSNLVSSFADSLLFIWIAFGFQWNFIWGQWVIKILIAALMIPLVIPKRRMTELPA
jgi:uncharacterized PurR-regulated membrane protein YhhQ (DUF165 family)